MFMVRCAEARTWKILGTFVPANFGTPSWAPGRGLGCSLRYHRAGSAPGGLDRIVVCRTIPAATWNPHREYLGNPANQGRPPASKPGHASADPASGRALPGSDTTPGIKYLPADWPASRMIKVPQCHPSYLVLVKLSLSAKPNDAGTRPYHLTIHPSRQDQKRSVRARVWSERQSGRTSSNTQTLSSSPCLRSSGSSSSSANARHDYWRLRIFVPFF